MALKIKTVTVLLLRRSLMSLSQKVGLHGQKLSPSLGRQCIILGRVARRDSVVDFQPPWTDNSDHILQTCPNYNDLRARTWSTAATLQTKLYGQPRGSLENCCLRPRDWCGLLNEANEEEEEEERGHLGSKSARTWSCKQALVAWVTVSFIGDYNL